ncbi:hypothetical protein BGP_5867 [Beggiatoa sp. PS]|nr:hypothetical protein BGP_5867 [Beggiatoa sp. PS]
MENPIVETLTGQAKDKAIGILIEHFTFTGQEISKGFGDSYGYALKAIRVGVAMPEQKFALAQKIRHSKITREFAEQIEQHYFQPFITESDNGVQSFSFVPDENGVQSVSFDEGVQSVSFDEGVQSVSFDKGVQSVSFDEGVQSVSFDKGVQSVSFVREQILDELKQLTQTKETLFEVQHIQEADLVALLNYQGTFAITDLVLEQIQAQTDLEKPLPGFCVMKIYWAMRFCSFFGN